MPDEPLWRRYRRFVRPVPRRDVDEEIAFHLPMRVDEYERSGFSPVHARESLNSPADQGVRVLETRRESESTD